MGNSRTARAIKPAAPNKANGPARNNRAGPLNADSAGTENGPAVSAHKESEPLFRLTAQWPPAVSRWRSASARRYSLTTISLSSASEVSALGLSNVISPCWIRLTRSQISST